MQFQVDPKQFKEALSKNDKLIGGLTFENCVLTADAKDTISVFSSSANCWLRSTIPAKVAKKGKVHTQAAVLSGLKLTGKSADFTVNSDSKLEFKCGRTKGFIETSPSDAELSKPPVEIKLDKKFDLKVFKELVTSMAYDADVLEVTEVKAISVRSDGKKLRMSTHDNYCMGYAEKDHPGLSKFEVVLPLTLLQGLLEYLTQDFEFGLSDQHVRIKTNEFDIVHSFVKPETQLVNMDEHLAEIKKETVVSEMFIKPEEVAKTIQEMVSFSYNDTVDAKIGLKAEGEKCSATLKLKHGQIGTSFKFEKLTKPVKTMASLWLFSQFLERIRGEKSSIKFFENKMLFSDKTRYYVMPVLTADAEK